MTDPTTSIAAVAVDALKGTIVERLLDPVVAPAWEALRPVLFPWWSSALHEIRLNLQDAVDELRQSDAEQVEALVRSLGRGEADALITGFLRAAAQATTEDRMKMLAAAAAGVITPDLNSEMRSRVSRTILTLEPSDVQELREVARYADSGHLFTDVRAGFREPLIRAACIVDLSAKLAFDGHIRVTELGRAVITTLRTWPRPERCESTDARGGSARESHE